LGSEVAPNEHFFSVYIRSKNALLFGDVNEECQDAESSLSPAIMFSKRTLRRPAAFFSFHPTASSATRIVGEGSRSCIEVASEVNIGKRATHALFVTY
jgi:hypothetical protein